MSIRGDKTHEHIINESRKLFAESGFSEITMKDVAAACGMSRGGLYRHFSSTGEIFAAIIENEQTYAYNALRRAVSDGIPTDVIVKTYIKNRIRWATNPMFCIDNAISEFAANDRQGRELVIKRAESAIAILTGFIETGVAEKLFDCASPADTARNIIWLIEGMAKHNALIPLTEQDTEAQLKIIMKMLGTK